MITTRNIRRHETPEQPRNGMGFAYVSAFVESPAAPDFHAIVKTKLFAKGYLVLSVAVRSSIFLFPFRSRLRSLHPPEVFESLTYATTNARASGVSLISRHYCFRRNATIASKINGSRVIAGKYLYLSLRRRFPAGVAKRCASVKIWRFIILRWAIARFARRIESRRRRFAMRGHILLSSLFPPLG